MCAGIVIVLIICVSNYAYSQAQSQSPSINLIDKSHIWRPFGGAKVSQSDFGLLIQVASSGMGKTFDRGVLITKMPHMLVPYHFAVDYLTNAFGNFSYFIEIRDIVGAKHVIWNAALTNNRDLEQGIFILPTSLTDKMVELRIYVVAETKGSGMMFIKAASLSPTYAGP